MLVFLLYRPNACYNSNITNRAAITNKQICGLVILLIVTCLRFDVGFDYMSYYNMVYPHLNDSEIERIEPFSAILLRFASYLGHPQFVFILFCLLNSFFLYKSFRIHSSNFFISVLVYISMFYLNDISVLRQAVACSITFYSFKYVRERKFILYLLFCLIAFLFHSSAIVAILIYFIYNYCNPLLTFVAMVLLYSLSKSVIYMLPGSDFTHFFDYMFDMNGGAIIKYVNIALLLLLIVYDRIKHIKNNIQMYQIVAIGLLFPFVFGSHLGNRVGTYFTMFFCLIIPTSLSKSSIPVYKFVVFLFMLYFLSTIMVSTNSSGSQYVPYRCVLFEDIDNPSFRR